MLDILVGQMLADANLTPAQTARVQEAAARVVAQLGPFDMIAVAGRMMAAKSCIDNGDQDAGLLIVQQLAEQYGVADLVADLAAEMHAQPAQLAPVDAS